MKSHATFKLGDIDVEVCAGSNSLWAILRRADQGGLALRLAYAPGGINAVRRMRVQADETPCLSVESAIGCHLITLGTDGLDLHRLRARGDLTPIAPLLVHWLPPDLYPLDA